MAGFGVNLPALLLVGCLELRTIGTLDHDWFTVWGVVLTDVIDSLNKVGSIGLRPRITSLKLS